MSECTLQARSIETKISHWFIKLIQSKHNLQISTDSFTDYSPITSTPNKSGVYYSAGKKEITLEDTMVNSKAQHIWK